MKLALLVLLAPVLYALIGLGVLRLAGLPTGASTRARRAYDLDGATLGPYQAGARIHIAWPPETAFRAGFNSWGMRGPEPREQILPSRDQDRDEGERHGGLRVDQGAR